MHIKSMWSRIWCSSGHKKKTL
ncbi:unnamed protein product, partial [Rotaria magnacalcarata]